MVERRQRATVVQTRIMSRQFVEVFFVRYGYRFEPENTVVLDDHNVWPDRTNRLPNPKLITINIDRKKPDILAKAGALNERVDILACYPCALCLEVKLPVEPVALNEADIFVAGIQHHTLPVVLEKQKSRVTFFVIFDAKFNERTISNRQMADQILNDSIFIPLRKYLESNASKIFVCRERRNLPRHPLA